MTGIFPLFTLVSFFNIIGLKKYLAEIIIVSRRDGGKALNINQIYDELTLRIDKNRMILDAPMKEYTSFKAGGSAALLVQPGNTEELSYALKVLSDHEVKHLVIG
ncbi:MAG TPA: hypothetical protein VM577_20895, partial [Anaerovoracaceae bacterium]|nr:hypothetical protein [Anaerovoracaceae bacterium]